VNLLPLFERLKTLTQCHLHGSTQNISTPGHGKVILERLVLAWILQ
jgi:hypothetical protein